MRYGVRQLTQKYSALKGCASLRQLRQTGKRATSRRGCAQMRHWSGKKREKKAWDAD